MFGNKKQVKVSTEQGLISAANLSIRLQPKQAQLLDMVENGEATWIGYGGSRGGAKSYALRSIMLIECLAQPNIRACIYRRTYDLVRENHLDPLLSEHPILRQYYHVGAKELRLPNGSILAFRYGETRADVDAMIGKEYKYFAVDQAEAFTEHELVVCKSCTRWPGSTAKMLLSFNPGNVGAAFLKRVFYDKQYKETERAEDFNFIQAYGWDNSQWCIPALTEAGKTEHDFYQMSNDERYQWFIGRSQYGMQLNALPQALRLGWLMGNMEKFSGQYYDNWNPDTQIEPVSPADWDNLWLGIDWGFAHPSVILWAVGLGASKIGIYREMKVQGYSPRALAQEICDRTPSKERSRIKTIWLSHDAFSKRDERDPMAVQMGRIFAQEGLPNPITAGLDPVGSASLIYDLLRDKDLVIDPHCPALIEVMPMICRNDTHPEKPIKFDGDDAFDALRHVVHGRVPRLDKPADKAALEVANAMTNPIARWFYLTKHKSRPPADIPRLQRIEPSWYIESGNVKDIRR